MQERPGAGRAVNQHRLGVAIGSKWKRNQPGIQTQERLAGVQLAQVLLATGAQGNAGAELAVHGFLHAARTLCRLVDADALAVLLRAEKEGPVESGRGGVDPGKTRGHAGLSALRATTARHAARKTGASAVVDLSGFFAPAPVTRQIPIRGAGDRGHATARLRAGLDLGDPWLPLARSQLVLFGTIT